MFRKTPKHEVTNYQPVIDKLMSELDEYGPDAEEFKSAMLYLDKIHKFQSANTKRSVDGNTIAIVVGNLLVVLIALAYEQKHVWTTKAFGFMLKPKN